MVLLSIGSVVNSEPCGKNAHACLFTHLSLMEFKTLKNWTSHTYF